MTKRLKRPRDPVELGNLIGDSPADCTGISIKEVEGRPNPKYISTSYVERQN